ncbi:MAG TPA: GxGYxYP family putative glycoside hydrolase [bacterium]|nr:GxGYxYP family putative glycoside hydrolase [bacterium]
MKRRWWALIVVALLCACLPEKPASKAKAVAGAPPEATAAAALGEKRRGGEGPSVFPKSPPPQHLIVLDGQSLSTPMRIMMASLQGVLAKTEPRLYFHPSIAPWNDPAHEEEGRWLVEMEAKWGVTSETAGDAWAVFDHFRDEVDGFIVYDPELPQTVNVATTLAGLRNAVIAHPDLIAELEARGLTASEDLRGRFADNMALYTWAFAEVWPQANQRLLAFVDDTAHPLRDYLVTHNVFTFQLDPHHYAERPLLETVLAGTPRDIPILGWPLDELLGVMLFSRYGKFHVASDYVSNLSAHSGLTAETLTQEHIVEFGEVENKIYVSFAYSDGDSLAYMNRWAADWFDDPAYGEIPLGWEISCSLVDLAPAVIGFFYDRLDERNMVIGPVSGIGYMYPNQWGDLTEFLRLTDTYLRLADMRTLWLINDDLTLPNEIADEYAQTLDLLGLFIDYWPNADKGWYITPGGAPVLRSRYVYLVGPEQIPEILADAAVEKEFLYPDEPTFVFIGVNAWVTSPTYIKEQIDALDERYEVIRPDAMFAALRAAAE